MFDAYAACGNFTQCTDTLRVPGLQDKYPARANAGVLGTLISDVLPLVLAAAGMVTVVIIVLSGIQFITSSGNPEAAGAAKNRLLYAILGFVVIILAFAVLQIVDALFLKSTIATS